MTKAQAHAVVADAIERGNLAHPALLSCADCGASATGYDHREYSKPLSVEPVCRACNHKRGPALDARKRRDRKARGEFLMVRVSDEEKAIIEEAAERAGYWSVAQYVRDVLLSAKLTKRIEAAEVAA